MNKEDQKFLTKITDIDYLQADAYNIRKNGKCVERKISDSVNIVSKTDGSGIDIYVKENVPFSLVDIPVIAMNGIKDIVYNDFHIGKGANVTIVAGCGVHACGEDTQHNGIHRFYLEENSKVKYIEKHYGTGEKGKKIINPETEVHMKPSSYMVMETSQIEGVTDTIRKTKAYLEDKATLIINEKILTSNNQQAKTYFDVSLNGIDSSCHVTSRSVATETSYQEFNSCVIGNNKSYGHVECDAIIKDNGNVRSIPEIYAKSVDATLVHEATIGKIAGEQFIKLMTLGLSEKEAEDVIINGFLK